MGGFIGRLGAGVVGAAALGFTAATGAAVGFGAKMTKVAADFETQMNIVEVAARSSGTSMEQLREAAIAVGADTELVGISASEAGEALENFYKAGLQTSDIFSDLEGYLGGNVSLTGALRSAVDLAAASELDLAQASDAVAIAMATFGLGAEEAGRIANSFVQTADGSVASVSELADSLKNVGPTAAAFGWSLEDTNLALGLLSERGIRGSEAGTALKSMMTNMMRPTTKVTGMLEELGVELYNTDGSMRRLPEIMGLLERSMAGLSDEERNLAIQTLAGTYGMKAMQTLLAEGVTGWNEMAGAVASGATAQETAAARTRGFHAATEQLQGSIESLMIRAGTPLIENVLTPMVQKLTEWIPVLEQVGRDALPVINDALTRIGVALGLTTEEVTGADVIMAAFGATLDAIVVGVQLTAVAFHGLAAAVETVVGWVQVASAEFEKLKGLTKGEGWAVGTGNVSPGSLLPPGLFGGARQHGGTVAQGRAYLVGEGGPELFMPGQSGAIMPGGGGPQIIQLVVDGRVLAQVAGAYQGREARQGARMGGRARL